MSSVFNFYRVDEGPIRPRYDNFQGKEEWLPWNYAWLISKREVRSDYGELPKGGNIQFEEVEILTRNAASPAVEHLYTIREENDKKKLDEKWVTKFHHAVAQLVFARPKARKDTQTEVYFLTTRVRIPDENDWGQLKRILRYVRRKTNPPLILRSDSLTVIKLWVDASYVVHPDMRRHMRATI